MHAQAALLSDRMVIEVSGEDRETFLQGLLTNDVEGLPEGSARFAALLTPQGKILFDFLVVRHGETHLLDTAKSIGADLLKRLTFYKLRAKVAIVDVTERWTVAAAWGAGAREWANALNGIAYEDPRLPDLGLRAFIETSSLRPDSFDGGSFESYEAMRIALAVPEGGKDYTYGDAFPHEACFDLLHGVNFKKGCYVGQEVVSRMQHRGTARTRVLAVSAGQALPIGGIDVTAEGFAVGRLGSVSGNRGIALARLDRVREALGKGQTLLAGNVPVELSVPSWASYLIEAEAAGAMH